MLEEKYTKDGHTVYRSVFNNVTELHDYLKSNPAVNRRVFETQASLDTDKSFYGESLKKSLEYCISGYNEGLKNFIETSEKLRQASTDLSDNRKMERGLFGGVPLSPLVASGVPDCMMKYEREKSSVVRNVYLNLTYPCHTTTDEIINRGIITLFIIQALEERGEMVNLKTFELSRSGDEIVNIELNLKRPGERSIDVSKCYFPLVRKEFCRRILFRLLESMPVTNCSWGSGYGRSFDREELKEYLELSSSDIIISWPTELGISGNDIYVDAERTIKTLELENEFDTEKILRLSKL